MVDKMKTAMDLCKILYIEICVLSIMFSLYILFSLMRESDRRKENLRLFHLIGAVSGVLFSDIILIILEGTKFPGAELINRIAYAVYHFLCPAVGLLWLRFIECRIIKGKTATWQKVLRAIPLVVAAVFQIMTILGSNYFFVRNDFGCYERGRLHWIQTLIECLYLLVFIVQLSVFFINPKVGKIQKRDAKMLIPFAFWPVIGGTLNMIDFRIPVIWPLSVFALFMVYVGIQRQMISTDGLTGLLNRRRFDSTLFGFVSGSVPERHATLMLLDIDDFKHINDCFGHQEGDIALLRSASILKELADRFGLKLFRYGGDEFAILGLCDDEKKLKSAIYEDFAKHGKCKDYELSVSIGCCSFNCDRSVTSEYVFSKADMALYKNKNRTDKENQF